MFCTHKCIPEIFRDLFTFMGSVYMYLAGFKQNWRQLQYLVMKSIFWIVKGISGTPGDPLGICNWWCRFPLQKDKVGVYLSEHVLATRQNAIRHRKMLALLSNDGPSNKEVFSRKWGGMRLNCDNLVLKLSVLGQFDAYWWPGSSPRETLHLYQSLGAC